MKDGLDREYSAASSGGGLSEAVEAGWPELELRVAAVEGHFAGAAAATLRRGQSQTPHCERQYCEGMTCWWKRFSTELR